LLLATRQLARTQARSTLLFAALWKYEKMGNAAYRELIELPLPIQLGKLNHTSARGGFNSSDHAAMNKSKKCSAEVLEQAVPEGCAHALAHAPGQQGRGAVAASLPSGEQLIKEGGDRQLSTWSHAYRRIVIKDMPA